MSTHDGHRERLRRRFLSGGLDNFEPHEILELMLTFAIPRRDTNEIAHNLINYFGSFSAVLEASNSELQKVDGVGGVAATLINLFKDVDRQYRIGKFGKKPILNTTKKQGAFCQDLHFGNLVETFYLICLTTARKVIAVLKLEEGIYDSVNVYITKIIEKALANKAAYILLTHNHPGGAAAPSPADIRVTFQVSEACRTVDLCFEDHIIIGDDMWFSLRENRCI